MVEICFAYSTVNVLLPSDGASVEPLIGIHSPQKSVPSKCDLMDLQMFLVLREPKRLTLLTESQAHAPLTGERRHQILLVESDRAHSLTGFQNPAHSGFHGNLPNYGAEWKH